MQGKQTDNENKKTWLEDREIGIFLLLSSIVGAYYFVYSPLRAMLDHEEYVSYSDKGIVLTIAGVLFGSIYTLFGRKKINTAFGKPTGLRLALYLLIVAAFTLGLIFAWNTLAGALGYGDM